MGDANWAVVSGKAGIVFKEILRMLHGSHTHGKLEKRENKVLRVRKYKNTNRHTTEVTLVVLKGSFEQKVADNHRFKSKGTRNCHFANHI